MDRQIRRLGVFLMLLFCALFAQLNYIQVFRADRLNTKPGNSRPIDQAFNRARGQVVTADGVVLARSVPVDDRYQYQREFPEGDLFGHVTGYLNYQFGATGLERAYNTELSGRSASQQVRSVGDLFVESDRTGNLRTNLEDGGHNIFSDFASALAEVAAATAFTSRVEPEVLPSGAELPAGDYAFARVADTEVAVSLPKVDAAEERARLEKELAETAAYVDRLTAQLANENFRSRAPANVIQGVESNLAEATLKANGLRERIAVL